MNEYTKINWQDGTVLQQAKVTIDGTDYEVTPAIESGTTPVNATNLNKMDTALKQAHDGVRDMEVNKINKATIELLTVDSTAPEHCSIGDMYYNTTTNLIYTATATDTWGTTGKTPSSKYLYVDLTNSKLYYYDGTNFTSYGGGSSNDVIISDTEPTEEDNKLWIDTGEIGSQASEITNEYSESTGIGYSANYMNSVIGKILWENSNPNSNMPNNTIINLLSDDYDILEIFYKYTTSNNTMWSKKIIKGYSAYLDIATPYYTTSNQVANEYRTFTRNSDTQYTVSHCNITYTVNSSITREDFIIPIYIVGYKTGLFS